MRGVVTETRFGIMPNLLVNWLLKPERVRKNIRNQFPSYIACYLLGLFDLIRERILKKAYRSLPVSFKIWYDKVRYRV